MEANKAKFSLAKSLVTSMFAMAVGAAFAVAFPNAGGNIADPDAWGGSVPSGQTVSFGQDGEYTALADVSFNALTVTAANATFDLGKGNPVDVRRKITLNGSLFGGTANQSVFWRNGEMRNKGFLLYGLENGNATGSAMNFSNMVFVASGLVRTAYKKPNARITFIDCPEVSLTHYKANYGSSGCNTRLEFLNGTKAYMSGALWTSDGYKVSAVGYTTNLVTVAGLGSSLWLTNSADSASSGGACIGHAHGRDKIYVTNGADFVNHSLTRVGYATGPECLLYIGDDATATLKKTVEVPVEENSWGNSFEIADRAEVTANAEMHIGYYPGTHDNTLVVRDSAKLTASNHIQLSYSSGGTSNRVEVLSGATLDCKNYLYVGGYSSGSGGGSYNALLVSNATLTVKRLYTSMGPQSVGNSVKVMGRNASLNFTFTDNYHNFFDNGQMNEFELSEGATWDNLMQGLRLDGAATVSNRVSILSGASLVLTNKETQSFSIGYNVGSNWNLFEVGDLALFKATGLYVSCLSNTVVVSNGTIQATKAGGYSGADITVGYSATSSGNRLILKGTTPKVKASSARLRILNSSEIVYDLGEGGYEKNYAPVDVKRFAVDASSTITLLGVPALCAGAHPKRVITLASGSGGSVNGESGNDGIVIDDTVVSAVNAQLASEGCVGCSVAVNAEKTKLTLTIPSTLGLVFTVK